MSERFDSRFKPIIVMFVLIGLLMAGKAANLQLFDNTFKDRGNAAAIEKAITYPERGLVYDRNGLLLVYNTLVYDLMVTYNSLNQEMDTAKFCELLDIDSVYFKENIVKD